MFSLVFRSICTRSLPLLAVALLSLSQANSVRAEAPTNVPPEGFTAIFNGTDLTGWCGRGHVHPKKFAALSEEQRSKQQAKADANFAKHWRVDVEKGEIVNDGRGVYCTTVKEYGDFELLIDWKMVGAGTDSGIYLRGSPQVQIWDPNDPSKRKHGGHLGSGGLWNNKGGSPGKNPLVKSDNPVGEWNTLRIKIVGDVVTIHQNGKLVVDNAVMHNFWNRKKPLYKQGVIQLQTHGGEMRFRNLFIRSLDSEEETESTDNKTEEKSAANAQPYTATIPGTKVTFDMLPISGGEFLMGSPEGEAGRKDDEGPQIQVRVEPFWMGKHEVTWAEYHLFMDLCNIFDKFNDLGIRQLTDENRVDAVTAPSKLYEPGFTYMTGDAPNQPAVSMTQYAAKQYCKWLSLLTGEFYRLPTEAEWEYACRAGTTTTFSFGDDAAGMDDHGIYYENGDDGVTIPVGSYKPNPWGLYDMHGNAAEWALDQYEADHYSKFSGQTTDASQLIQWPTKLYQRVLRGGSWDSEIEECRSAARLASDDIEWKTSDPHNPPSSPWWFASNEGQKVGFRLIRPLTPPPRSEWNLYWRANVAPTLENANYRIDKDGRGEWGLVNPGLADAIKKLEADE